MNKKIRGPLLSSKNKSNLNDKTLVSVIIPTYNEEKDIGDCLETLKIQDYKNVEIIIVDDGSTDKTKEIVKSIKSVKLIEGQHRGPGFSRNLGAKVSKGKILVFVDADMTFPRDYIKNLIKPIIKGKCFGTEEKIQYASNANNIWSKCWGSYTKKNYFNLGLIFRAILKTKFFEMGGFNPKYGYADDLTFYFKYGAKSVIAKEAFCYHKNPETLHEVYNQSRWIGASLPSKWKVLSMPFLKYPVTLLLYPSAIFIIPLLTLYKALTKKKFLIPYLFIFYTVRYFGTLKGIYRINFKGINTR